jgi:hypothetical protein
MQTIFASEHVGTIPAMPAGKDSSITTAAISNHKAAILQRLRAMQAEGLSLQGIANQLNAEGVPTLSGKGRWQKDTISNLLSEVRAKGPIER